MSQLLKKHYWTHCSQRIVPWTEAKNVLILTCLFPRQRRCGFPTRPAHLAPLAHVFAGRLPVTFRTGCLNSALTDMDYISLWVRISSSFDLVCQKVTLHVTETFDCVIFLSQSSFSPDRAVTFMRSVRAHIFWYNLMASAHFQILNLQNSTHWVSICLLSHHAMLIFQTSVYMYKLARVALQLCYPTFFCYSHFKKNWSEMVFEVQFYSKENIFPTLWSWNHLYCWKKRKFGQDVIKFETPFCGKLLCK